MKNETKFLTNLVNGNSGLSVYGLSKISGIKPETIKRWLKGIDNKQPVEGLKHLIDVPIYLDYPSRENKKTKIIRSEVCNCILFYAAFQKHSIQAYTNLELISHIGLKYFIQERTGYLTGNNQKTDNDVNKMGEIIDHQTIWTRLYNDKIYNRVVEWFDKWFYYDYMVAWMYPLEIPHIKQSLSNYLMVHNKIPFIQEILPFFTQGILKPHAMTLYFFIETAKSKTDFEYLFFKHYDQFLELDKQLTLQLRENRV